MLKRKFDILPGVTALLCLAPVLLMTALVVRLGRGSPAKVVRTLDEGD